MSLYLVESSNTDTQTILHEFHRTKEGKKVIKKITTAKPYFFVDEGAPIDKWEQVIKVVRGFKSIEGTPVKQVFVNRIRDVKSMRKGIATMGFKSHEADIYFHNRYTNDLPVIEKTHLYQCFLDIETDSDDKFPDIDTANHAVCCLTIKMNGKMKTWLCGEHITKDILSQLKHTIHFKREDDMLENFVSWLKKEQPDIITAWNINNFDLRYLINRFERLNVEYRHISPLNQVYIKQMYMTNTYYVKIKGMVVFDQLEAYKLWRKYGNMPVLASYSLDFVARTVLGEQKIDHGKTMHWLWMNDVKTLVEYNQWDVELLDMIEERCKIIDFFDELRRKCRIQFDDVYKTTAMIDGYLIKRLNKSIILPNSRYGTGEKFKGAFVYDPKKGLYDNIMCLDIKAFYPNMIKTFNISYETINGEIKLPIGTSFSKKPGIVPMFLDELAEERAGYKKKMYAAKTDAEFELWHQRQYGTKVIMNSFFGYLGFPGARLYRPEVASSITGMGEYIIKEIIKWLAEIDYKVIYGDTDSVYVKAKYTHRLSVVNEGFELTEYINKKLEEFSLNITDINTLEIEFEKAMKKMLFTEAKKKYAYKLLWKDKKNFDVDDKMELVGFGAKRSDSNKVSKIVQREVLERVLNGESKKDVLAYVKGMRQKMIDREFSDEDIGFPKGIKKSLAEYCPPGPIIKGAVFSNLHYNTNFEKDSKPKFVWIKSIEGIGKPIVVVGRKEYELESMTYQTKIPNGVNIDWKRMAESTFKKKLENIFDSAGWGWTRLDVIPLSDFF